ncbi:hypothetical protein [Burkholderia cenocepacia]|jgi:NAD(P)-dependent dehydrogenase (short-subunit alcohol dehydrogenase family)|uniref:hypothetical protein n=1 Tax=Burkholderia cenocepacia TaxID=95486 RepID=UPI0002AC862B|nr:hypothetical protein [Burkholderia cenocepacia]KIS52038.1 putative oxidoreductase domain protein [Burkholderia cepacia]EPZ84986.1 hypothetical protein BURCENK562V_C7010 [Burkholderia cenocepacia K56-2Valvano]ERI25057.1 hypothetical protein BURCENBC7_AP0666 [Burkholderia cenocepacia BC7]KKI82311.1 oxidoreductase [Burkholderia cenocepacia]MDN7696602.1 oxidoreductase [Burkholderia cenocepacia]
MDKVILIKGASSGIGEGIARALAAPGAKFMLGRGARTGSMASRAISGWRALQSKPARST